MQLEIINNQELRLIKGYDTEVSFTDTSVLFVEDDQLTSCDSWAYAEVDGYQEYM